MDERETEWLNTYKVLDEFRRRIGGIHEAVSNREKEVQREALQTYRKSDAYLGQMERSTAMAEQLTTTMEQLYPIGSIFTELKTPHWQNNNPYFYVITEYQGTALRGKVWRKNTNGRGVFSVYYSAIYSPLIPVELEDIPIAIRRRIKEFLKELFSKDWRKP